MAFLVDILSGVLSGSAFGKEVHNLKRETEPGEIAAPNVGHFFLVLDIARFMPLADFKSRLDSLIDQLKDSRKALDQERVFIHGEKEFAKTAIFQKYGIPLAENVFNNLCEIAQEVGHPNPTVVPAQSDCPFLAK